MTKIDDIAARAVAEAARAIAAQVPPATRVERHR